MNVPEFLLSEFLPDYLHYNANKMGEHLIYELTTCRFEIAYKGATFQGLFHSSLVNRFKIAYLSNL